MKSLIDASSPAFFPTCRRALHFLTALIVLSAPLAASPARAADKDETRLSFWGGGEVKPSVKVESDRLNTVIGGVSFTADDQSVIKSGTSMLAIVGYTDPSRRKVEAKTAGTVEAVLMEKLIEGGIRIRECLECNSASLVLDGQGLRSSLPSDLKRRLETLSRQIGVDGYLFWTVYSENERIRLDITVIRARSGGYLFSKTFVEPEPVEDDEKERKDPYRITVVGGVWGMPVEKVETNLPTKTYRNAVGAVGARVVKTAKDNRSVEYGLGSDIFSGVLIQDKFNVNGLALYGHMSVALDSYFFSGEAGLSETAPGPAATGPSDTGETETPTSLVNYYLSLGETFFMDNHTVFAKTGIEFRFGGRLMLDIGLVGIPKTGAVYSTTSGYDPTIYFGGTSYELLLGYTF